MNNCVGYQINGFIRKVESLNSKQLVLELQPSSEILAELCAFCDVRSNQDSPLKNTTHSHEIKGSLLVNPENNHLIFTLENGDKENSQTNLLQPSPCVDEDEFIPPPAKIDRATNQQSTLQYEVDGKVYALKSTFPKKKSSHQNRSSQPNDKQNSISKATKFHIDDKTYSIMKINTKPFEEAYRISEEEQQAMHRSLELLQVFQSCFQKLKMIFISLTFFRSN